MALCRWRLRAPLVRRLAVGGGALAVGVVDKAEGLRLGQRDVGTDARWRRLRRLGSFVDGGLPLLLLGEGAASAVLAEALGELRLELAAEVVADARHGDAHQLQGRLQRGGHQVGEDGLGAAFALKACSSSASI